MYVKQCKLSALEQDKLFFCYVFGVSATKASCLVGVHRNSSIRFFRKLREKNGIEQLNHIKGSYTKTGLNSRYLAGIKKRETNINKAVHVSRVLKDLKII